MIHYTGTLEDGKKFDSSYDRNQPYGVTIGRRDVILGWIETVKTMKKGTKRKIIIPSRLGYGKRGNPPDIPPDATLVFEMEAVDIK